MHEHSEEYLSYIGSAEWQEKRHAVLARCQGFCEECGEYFGNALQTHHDTYENLGDEPLSDLRALCPECHEHADSEREEDTASRLQEINAEWWESRWRAWANASPSMNNDYDDIDAEKAFINFLIEQGDEGDIPNWARPPLLWKKATRRTQLQDEAVLLPGRPLPRDKFSISPTKLGDYLQCPLKFYHSHIEVPPKDRPPVSMYLAYAQCFKQLINNHLSRHAKGSEGSLETLPLMRKEDFAKELKASCFETRTNRFGRRELILLPGYVYPDQKSDLHYLVDRPREHVVGLNNVIENVLRDHYLLDTNLFFEIPLQGFRYRSVIDTVTLDNRDIVHLWMWSTSKQYRDGLDSDAKLKLAYKWGRQCFAGHDVKVRICRPHFSSGTPLSYSECELQKFAQKLEQAYQGYLQLEAYPASTSKLCSYCPWKTGCNAFKEYRSSSMM